jgi:glycerol-3-phosphate dehydrogenase
MASHGIRYTEECMKRDLNALASKSYDVVVIGGGIFGACIAHDAAARGLSVALFEKDDFGGATSYASMRVIHGGLRYLQSGNLPLMVNMKKEQHHWLQIAPHLIRSMPCLISTYDSLTKSQLAYTAALAVNNSSNWLVNRKLRSDKHLPFGRLLSRQAAIEQIPSLEKQGLTGAAIWDEGYMDSSERLLLAFLQSAARSGAQIANYTQVTGFLKENKRVCGVTVTDQISGRNYDISARLVINSAGAWVDPLLKKAGRQASEPSYHLSIAFNIVTRQLFAGFLAGFPARPRRNGGSKLGYGPVLFAAPWQNYTMIGTRHLPYSGSPDENPIRTEDVQDFLEEINTACPDLSLTMDDVCGVVHGYLPMTKPEPGAQNVKLVRDIQIFDNANEGIDGLMTVIGVRYTLARFIAQKAVDMAVQKLGVEAKPCTTSHQPLVGADFNAFQRLQADAQASRPEAMSQAVMDQLLLAYGSEYTRLLELIGKVPQSSRPLVPGGTVIEAQVTHAVREEMALKINDVLQRRTGLFPLAEADDATLERCADIMAQELDWNEEQRRTALAEARRSSISNKMGMVKA